MSGAESHGPVTFDIHLTKLSLLIMKRSLLIIEKEFDLSLRAIALETGHHLISLIPCSEPSLVEHSVQPPICYCLSA
jgi:hypothetical protein